jgi:hypothetical protein
MAAYGLLTRLPRASSSLTEVSIPRSFARGLARRPKVSKPPPPRGVAAVRSALGVDNLNSAPPPPHSASAEFRESTRPARADDASVSGRAAYREYWEALVKQEWEHELSVTNERLKKWPVSKLEKEGLSASGLVGSQRAYRFYDRPVARFTLRSEAPRHSFQPGDEVVLSRSNPLTEIDALKGEILEITRAHVEIAFMAGGAASGQVRRRAVMSCACSVAWEGISLLGGPRLPPSPPTLAAAPAHTNPSHTSPVSPPLRSHCARSVRVRGEEFPFG